MQAGREVAYLYREPGWFQQAQAAIHFPSAAQAAALYAARRWFLLGYALLILRHPGRPAFAQLSAPAQRRRGHLWRWPRVELHRGATILEASRQAGIPHASVCGGRGRCSTCRVRIVAGLERSAAGRVPTERRVLERVGRAAQRAAGLPDAADPAGRGRPLLPAREPRATASARPGYLQGREQEIAILFADLRAFTKLAHQTPAL